MMLKLIVVDDERNAAELVVRCLEKSNLNLKTVGIFESAPEALEYIKHNTVDIVLTDIKMPEMDGLTFLEILSENYPSVKTVVFSGFDDFNFAKRALSFGVCDYLLKPIVLKELFECLKKVSKRITAEKRIDENETLTEAQEAFINDIAMGTERDFNDYSVRFDLMNFPFTKDKSGGAVITVKVSEKTTNASWKYPKSTVPTAVMNIIGKYTPDTYLYYMGMMKNTFKFVAVGEKNKIDTALLEKEIKNKLEMDTHIEILFVFKTLWDMAQGYSKNVSSGEKLAFYASQVVMGNNEKAEMLLSEIMKECPEDSREKFIEQLKKVLAYNEAEKLNLKDLSEKESDDRTIISAKQYIKKNYMKDITRDDVADAVFMNSSYFSRYFSRKMGISFYDYLVKIRMEKAKDLLLTQIKIGDISRKVGYQYPKYFIKNFKKYTGYTPSDYRKYVLQIEESVNEE